MKKLFNTIGFFVSFVVINFSFMLLSLNISGVKCKGSLSIFYESLKKYLALSLKMLGLIIQ